MDRQDRVGRHGAGRRDHQRRTAVDAALPAAPDDAGTGRARVRHAVMTGHDLPRKDTEEIAGRNGGVIGISPGFPCRSTWSAAPEAIGQQSGTVAAVATMPGIRRERSGSAGSTGAQPRGTRGGHRGHGHRLPGSGGPDRRVARPRPPPRRRSELRVDPLGGALIRLSHACVGGAREHPAFGLSTGSGPRPGATRRTWPSRSSRSMMSMFAIAAVQETGCAE